MAQVEKGGIQTADPSRIAVRVKLDRYYELLSQLHMHDRDLDRLKKSLEATSGEVPGLSPGGDASGAVVFKSLRAKVPAEVFELLYFMELRAVQRSRQKQQACGLPHQATHRMWTRQMYSMVRMKIWIYLKAIARRKEEAQAKTTNLEHRTSASSEDAALPVEPSVDWDTLPEKNLDIDEIEMALNPVRVGIKEPRRENRDRSKTEAGKAYLKRKRQTNKQRRKAKKRGELEPEAGE